MDATAVAAWIADTAWYGRYEEFVKFLEKLRTEKLLGGDDADRAERTIDYVKASLGRV